jgi:hypothetical protein
MKNDTEMVWAFFCIKTVVSMREIGKMISETGKGLRFSLMDRSMWDTLWLIKLMDKDYILGPTVKYSKGSGIKELNQVLACGKVKMGTVTVVSGTTVAWKVTASISGSTAIVMKANG